MGTTVEYGIKLTLDGNKAVAEGLGQVNSATAQVGNTSEQVGQKIAAAQKAVVNSTGQLAASQAKVQEGVKALAAAAPEIDRVGVSAKQTAAALRGVPAQFTDIVTSIQGGQAPLTVLLQQGGQLKDMFGGTGAAARALGGYVLGLVNPFTVVAGVATVVALAYHEGQKEAEAYARAIILSGNAAGTTSDQLSDMARNVSKSVGTQGAAAEALTALVSTGQVAADGLQQYARVAVQMERTISQSVADTAKEFADLGRAPITASEKLNEQYHYLTAAVYVQIKALQDQGRTEEAAAAAQSAYANALDGRTKKLESNLGALERGWLHVKDAAKAAWDGMLNIGRPDTLEQQLADVQAKIKKAQGPFDASLGGNAEARVRLKEYLALEASLKEQVKSAREKADADAESDKLNKAQIAWIKEGDQYLSRKAQLEKEITIARQHGADAAASGAEIEKRVGDIRKKYADIFNASIDGQIEGIKLRAQIEDVFAKRSLDQLTANHAVGMMSEKDYIEETARIELFAFDKRSANLALELALTKSKQNSQKEQAALQGEIDIAAEERISREIQLTNDLNALEVKRFREAVLNYANLIDKADGERDSLRDQLAAQLIYNSTIGQTSMSIAELSAARLDDLAARKDSEAELAEGVDMSGVLAEKYREQAQALRDLATARRTGANMDLAIKFDDKMWRDTEESAKEMAQSMQDIFGNVGGAIGKMTVALVDYQKTQRDILRDLEKNKSAANGDQSKIIEAESKASRDSANAQIKQYGDIAQAASGFFDKGSKGYQVLHAAEQAFRIFELAMTAESMARKLFAIGAITTATVGAEAVKTTAITTGTGIELAADMVKGTSAAAVGVATQAAGDPYTAWARMAAMAATMAGLGFAVGGLSGGGADIAKQRQDAAGTGTILGDSTAKSDSIARSMSLLEENSNIELTHTAGMLASLRNIESSIGGLGNLIGRSLNITTPTTQAALGFETNAVGKSLSFLTGADSVTSKIVSKIPVVGEILSGLMNTVTNFISKGFGTKTSLVDNGIFAAPQSLDSVQNTGLAASAYADIEKTKKFLWISYSKSIETEFSGLSAEVTSQLGLVINNLATSTKMATELLGVSGDTFSDAMQGFVVDLGKISLKGLTGEEIQTQFETIFSALGDKMARQALPALDQFQKVGEGYFETLTRVATNYANLDSILSGTGSTFGAVGVASIAAREHFIELAGGIDQLAQNTNSFAQNYLSEAERLAPVSKYVEEGMAALGLASVTTRAAFKDVVLGLNLTSEADQKRYVALMDLESAFAKVHVALDDTTAAAKTTGQVLDERKELQKQLDQLTLTSTQLLEQQRNAIDESNRAMFDQIQTLVAANEAAEAQASAAKEAAEAAASAAKEMHSLDIQLMTALGDAEGALRATRADTLSALLSDTARVKQQEIWAANDAADVIAKAKASADVIQANIDTARGVLTGAYQRESTALRSLITAKRDEAAATRAQIDALKLGALSTLSPQAKYAEARRQFDSATGAGVAAAGNAFLEASAAFNAHNEDYDTDYRKVQEKLAASATNSEMQASIAEMQLTTMDLQVSGLININDSINSGTATLVQGLAGLATAISAQGGAPIISQQGSAFSGSASSQQSSGVAAKSGDSALLQAAKVMYQSVTGGVSTSAYDAAQEAVGGDIQKATGWTGDPSSFRAAWKFAKGGVFTNGIVTKPTSFNIDEMGEAGAEAIIPLANTSGGLGVRAIGGDNKPELRRQTAAIERQNELIEAQSGLLQDLVDAIEISEKTNTSDLRDVRKYIGAVVSKAVAR